MDPETHYFLSESQLLIAEKFLKEIYPYTGNKPDKFQIDEVNTEEIVSNKNAISDMASDLGNISFNHKKF